MAGTAACRRIGMHKTRFGAKPHIGRVMTIGTIIVRWVMSTKRTNPDNRHAIMRPAIMARHTGA